MLDFPSVFDRIRSCTMYFFSVCQAMIFPVFWIRGRVFSSAVLIGDFDLGASPLPHSGYVGGKRKSTTSLLKSHVPSQSALFFPSFSLLIIFFCFVMTREFICKRKH